MSNYCLHYNKTYGVATEHENMCVQYMIFFIIQMFCFSFSHLKHTRRILCTKLYVCHTVAVLSNICSSKFICFSQGLKISWRCPCVNFRVREHFLCGFYGMCDRNVNYERTLLMNNF
jgi:hypothetical protein